MKKQSGPMPLGTRVSSNEKAWFRSRLSRRMHREWLKERDGATALKVSVAELLE
jgi:hypothetical protein